MSAAVRTAVVPVLAWHTLHIRRGPGDYCGGL